MRIVVGMSGGVDSSVVAAKLVEEGHDVIGLMLRLWSEPSCKDNRCCAPEAVEQARMIAGDLGIPFYVLDYKQQFKEAIVDPFVQTYLAGETPNPCVLCNQKIRFGAMMDEALKLGADRLATGHYAQLIEHEAAFELHKGADSTKDQSYVLYRLSQAQLRRCLFPLGGINKTQTRELAAKYGLEVASKPDSQDLCFVGEDGYRGFLGRATSGLIKPGKFVDTDGNILGDHHGLPFYTVGQRRGLGISFPQPMYVLALDSDQNQVVLGKTAQRFTQKVVVSDLLFQQDPEPFWGKEISARIRYNSSESLATIQSHADGAELIFNEPVADVTPGQAAVFYHQDMVIGGGKIKE